MGRGGRGGLDELLNVWVGWVGGWVGGRTYHSNNQGPSHIHKATGRGNAHEADDCPHAGGGY